LKSTASKILAISPQQSLDLYQATPDASSRATDFFTYLPTSSDYHSSRFCGRPPGVFPILHLVPKCSTTCQRMSLRWLSSRCGQDPQGCLDVLRRLTFYLLYMDCTTELKHLFEMSRRLYILTLPYFARLIIFSMSNARERQ
jgi:hypothetical protein